MFCFKYWAFSIFCFSSGGQCVGRGSFYVLKFKMYKLFHSSYQIWIPHMKKYFKYGFGAHSRKLHQWHRFHREVMINITGRSCQVQTQVSKFIIKSLERVSVFQLWCFLRHSSQDIHKSNCTRLTRTFSKYRSHFT